MNQGVPQGSLISPFLFNLFINNMIEKLNSLIGITCLGYADDIGALTLSRRDADRTIKEVKSWCH